MVMIILMWLIVCCVIGFALGLFGVLVPGPQWWRKSRSRAAQIMGGSFVVFIIITMISANLVHEQSDVGGPSASPTPSASRESVPTTKIIQEDTAVGTIVRRQEVPPGSSLKVIARRHGDGVMVQLDTNLPKNTMVSVSVGREYYEVGNPETYIQDYFSEKGTIDDWVHARTIPINNATWKKKLGMHQSEMAKISSLTAFEIDRIEDDVTVRVIVPGAADFNREALVPYPLDAKPEPLVTVQPQFKPSPRLQEAKTDPQGFQQAGFIQNGVGEKCWYIQRYEETNPYFMPESMKETTHHDLRTILFEDPRCMNDALRGSDGYESINKRMIMRVVSSWFLGAYFVEDAYLDVDTIRRPGKYQSRGVCIRSKNYPNKAIAYDFVKKGNSIVEVKYMQSLGMCGERTNG